MSTEEHSSLPAFGNAIQRYAQQLSNALSKFKVTADLEDGNYSSWSRSIFDNLETLELHHYLLVRDFKDPDLSPEKSVKTVKAVVNHILNRLDKTNNTQATNHLIDPEDPQKIVYDPYSLWNFLKDRHFLINAQQLSSISKVVNNIKIQPSDSLTNYLDKFESLFVDYVRYQGKMDNTQSALRLIDSID